MECTKIREACSAALDGEPTAVAPGAIAEHLESCAACRGFVDDAHAMRRAFTNGRPDGPDMTDLVLAAARAERHPRGPGTTALRLGLFAVAAAQLALAVPTLLFGSDEGAPLHIAHEVGAWNLALAVGFVFAAWRPLRAVGLLPFAAALSAGLLATAVVDVLDGRAIALTETTHLLELAGTALLWLLAAPRMWRRARPILRVV
jgi:predicted anti-sigma-YlaC factor YlaD